MIEIFTICYNEEIILQKFIDHYRTRFPNCEITIYDNMSTDYSRQIAIKNGCRIIDYDSNNQIRDDLYLEIKNNCWKNANTDWVLIVDTDEFIYINEQQLKNEESLGKTIISFEGWNLITMSDNPDIIDLDLKCGSRAAQYDKSYLFNKKFIKEINYSAGCHYCTPKGKIQYSENKYLMCHWKALGLNYMINRHTEFGKRMSKQNLDKGWGVHYLYNSTQIRDNWKFYQEHPENKKIL